MSVHVEAFQEDNFESLMAAVSQTAQGRWFLHEYSKRQRSTENLAIMEAVRKLENAIKNPGIIPAQRAPEAPKPLSPQQLKFFKQDEEIFVETPVAAPAFQVVGPAPKVEAKPPQESKGAKLKIQRLHVESPLPETRVEPIASEPAPKKQLSAAIEPAAVDEPKQRVIIIRKPSSEIADISTLEDAQAEVAA